MQCPVCKKRVAFKSPNMPFCSDRCRIIDLGDWASEKHVISTPAHGKELEEGLESLDLRETGPQGFDPQEFKPGSGRVQ